MKTLKITEQNGIARVILNRPDVKNAFNPEMISELTACFEGFNRNADVRVVILSGEGSSFCAGADLGWMKSMKSFSLAQNRDDSRALFEMFESIRVCPVPVLGRLHGHVMGGALGLAAVCDIAAAETATAFCFSEVKLGLVPAVISPFVLQKVTRSGGQRYMLTGEVFKAEAAHAVGLIQHHGDLSSVDTFIEETAKAIVANGPLAVRDTKKLLRFVNGTNDWHEIREETSRVIAERRVSDEGQEGLTSFFEKRAPSWRPQKDKA